MAEKPSHYHPHAPNDKIQSALSILEENMFIKAYKLLNRVTVAAKDANRRVRWVTLDPTYHSILVRTTIAATKANGPSCLIASIKEALFILILNILNGKQKQKQNFFGQLEQERKPKRDECRSM